MRMNGTAVRVFGAVLITGVFAAAIAVTVPQDNKMSPLLGAEVNIDAPSSSSVGLSSAATSSSSSIPCESKTIIAGTSGVAVSATDDQPNGSVCGNATIGGQKIFQWTAPASGTLGVSVYNGDGAFDDPFGGPSGVYIGVDSGLSCPGDGYPYDACEFPSPYSNPGYDIAFSVTNGVTYYITIAGEEMATTNNFTMSWTLTPEASSSSSEAASSSVASSSSSSSPPTVSGTVYTDEGVTNIGANKTVRLVVDGTTSQITTTNASGVFTFSLSYSAGAILTALIDNETQDGVTITRGATGDITGLNIYQDHLIVRSEDASPMTSANINTGNDGDADITAIVSDGASPVVAAGKELFVWTGDTYAPGATLDIDGSLDIRGTLDVAGNPVTLAQTLSNAGTLTCSTGTDFTLDGTAAQSVDFGSGTIDCDVIDSNTTAAVTLATNGLTANRLAIGNGAIFSLNGQDLTLNSVTTTLTNDGTLRLRGSESVTDTQDTDSGTWEYVGDGDGNADTFTIQEQGTTDYYHLVINATDAGDVFNSIGGNKIIAGSFTLTSGTFTAPSILLLGGDFTQAGGTFTHNSGTISFDGTSQTINGNSTTFYNVMKTNSTNDSANETLTFQSAETVTIAGTLTLDGLDANDKIVLAASTGGNAATIALSGASCAFGTTDYLTITDHTLTAVSGCSATLPRDPDNSVGSNTTNWFTVVASSSSSSSTSSSAGAVCGNNVIEGSETCDGTAFAPSQDSCSEWSAGYTGGSLRCMNNCTSVSTQYCAPQCANGMVETSIGETCDDGNFVNGDGCNASCQQEPIKGSGGGGGRILSFGPRPPPRSAPGGTPGACCRQANGSWQYPVFYDEDGIRDAQGNPTCAEKKDVLVFTEDPSVNPAIWAMCQLVDGYCCRDGCYDPINISAGDVCRGGVIMLNSSPVKQEESITGRRLACPAWPTCQVQCGNRKEIVDPECARLQQEQRGPGPGL